MRLLIAEMDERSVMGLEQAITRAGLDWTLEYARDGLSALKLLEQAPCELMLINACLPRLDGEGVVDSLWRRECVSPPRVLMLTEPELKLGSAPVDCLAPLYSASERRTALLKTLSTRLCPMLAQKTRAKRRAAIGALLGRLEMPEALKGREYILWLLDTLIHSPFLIDQLTNRLYPLCAKAHGASPASVERCVRHAIEQTFTVGSMAEIEAMYGAAIDEERGKLTNRAFLSMTAQRLRHSLATP